MSRCDRLLIQGDQLKWGDEIEYMVVKMDEEKGVARLALRAQELLPKLMEAELRGDKDLDAVWRPEYAAYMIEGTPGIYALLTSRGRFYSGVYQALRTART